MKASLFYSLIIALNFLAVTSFGQSKIGSDIDGESAGDLSGYSLDISSDGTRLIIGAYLNSGSAQFAGHARVYQRVGAAWLQLGSDIDGEAMNDWSGSSVSISSDGKRVGIGSPNNKDKGIFSGQVRAYEWDGSSWKKLGADIEGKAGEGSGWSVSFSHNGSRLAIGSPGIGLARVFEWSGSQWKQLGSDILGEDLSDLFGEALSLSESGNHLAVGAAENSGNGFASGHVRVYEWKGGNWTQVGHDIDGEAREDRSGRSLAITANGKTVAIGASDNSDSFTRAGHARVYNWNGSSWTQLGSDIDGLAVDENFGYSLSLSLAGRQLAVGAPGNKVNGNAAGQARFYAWNGLQWTQVGMVVNGEDSLDACGRAIVLSGDGLTSAIGAWHNDGNGLNSGHVRVYGSLPLGNKEENALTSISVFPNPSDAETIFIQMNENLSGTSVFELCDYSGKSLRSGQLFFHGGRAELKLNLESGVYILSIKKGSTLVKTTIITK